MRPSPLPATSWFGLFALAASVPLLLWQAIPVNQVFVSNALFLSAHSLMEIFAVIVAALVFFAGFGAHETQRSLRSMVLGYAFLAVALLDVLHFLSYPGMPDLVSENSAQKTLLFWLAARSVAATGLLAYILIPEAVRVGRAGQRAALSFTLLAVLAIAWLPLTRPAELPLLYVAGLGLTTLKIVLEWFVFGVCLGAAVLLFARRARVANCDVRHLGIALLLMAASELFFTYYIELTSTTNLLGHAYKVLGYYFLYVAIYTESVGRPFRQMHHMLSHDDLTGLPNRVAFSERLDATLAAARGQTPCAVLLLDLDQFQSVNDTLGHEQGDVLLVAVARRIRETLPADAWLARFSGDEFMILQDGANTATARDTGEAVQRALAREFELGDDRLGISASIGIVTYPANGASASELMRYADLALHDAKAAGRNGLRVFSQELAESVGRRVLLETRLKHALANAELVLVYQPKFATASGRLSGWEALLRWHSPELGWVSPDEFIPVAEHSGLILPIGDWVLREACRQRRAWQDAGLTPGSMAVNLSTRQFRQKDLTEAVMQVLADTRLAPRDLELELTESALMDNLAAASEVLASLARLGIRIAIDDFGTGYSSLSYLKRFAIHSLKIDRSFVDDLPGDEHDTAIVRTVIALAKSLGLTVVAEGVETDAQLAYLRANQCDEVQGYLLSKPLPPDACVALMRESVRRETETA